MTLQEYMDRIGNRFRNGFSKEHAYRGDLENLLRALAPDADITNEPANVTDCGNPDYVITRGRIPVGYIEAKDIGKDLKSAQYREQFGRYRKALDNLMITDYLWFRFFQHDKLVHEIRIGEVRDGKIVALPENFDLFTRLIAEFCTFAGQTIRSAPRLAELMAGKARLLQNILERAVTSDEQTEENTSLQGQLKAFRDVLIHDISPRDFADIYAQTLAYGMFAARLHDTTSADFSRQAAAELIPKSNPFLRKLFQYIAGYDIDGRIRTTVDNLADVFRAADVGAIVQNFGQTTRQHDPVIHFYETFLAKYDPKLRKSRGVWYTPEPVVSFIVRAVDDILKSEFGLTNGLADTSKTQITVREQGTGKNLKKEVHRVQILDPATGTGTFLAEVVKHIYKTQFRAMQGAWSGYVENELIPRLKGFELLMASYAMAHLKLEMLLNETGYKPETAQRLHVYLTNSLEEHHPDTGTLFAQWLSTEANEANHLKRDTPVMVVMGNPPYSGHSANKGEWIERLLKDYKQEPGGGKLQERNSKWLNDDYVKFIRYGQYFVEKNGEGVLAYINNHGFLDNPTFRGMRWHLLSTFDKIYIIDLHGNAKKKEVCPDGSPDKNVFDIQQGVSVNIFVKTGKKRKNALGRVFHYDLYGDRESKYDFLWKNSIGSVKFSELRNGKPLYFFVQKDFETEKVYKKGVSVAELFPVNSVGIVTARDAFTIHDTPQEVEALINDFVNLEDEEARKKYNLGKDVRDWKVRFAKKDLILSGLKFSSITQISYRPFDTRHTYYTGKSKGFHCMPRGEVMQHFINDENTGLMLCKQFKAFEEYHHSFVTQKIFESSLVSNKTSEISYGFPLYLYPSANGQKTFDDDQTRKPNLNMKMVRQIEKKLGLRFTPEKETAENTFAPIDLLDYIYAVLHSPTYRQKYREFLKIDFPRVPYPRNPDAFRQLAAFGAELRQIHLLESPQVENLITTYPEDGDNRITRKIVKKDWELCDEKNSIGRIRINDRQYFDNIPLAAWEFYIGGYQPAQKWLKDRSPANRNLKQGRVLSFDDILHYTPRTLVFHGMKNA
ncbi:DNA methyltransferase [Desulfonema ishimotonii]|uniref:site-specific DNA-methyltransferase (adenine-specific) n=2 Tax=Desulfonema ishimotonii TaxID=45657 RepID=A0A401FS96_9BACT|nr:DNA methyltransferase [Desulfonema ishimotonii]